MNNYPDFSWKSLFNRRILVGWLVIERYEDENGLPLCTARPVTWQERMFVEHVWCDVTIKVDFRRFEVVE